MTGAETTADNTVRIELVNRASVRMRVAHSVAKATIRPFVEWYFGVADSDGPLRGARAFRVANFADLLAAPLIPPRGTLRRSVTFDRFRAEWLWHREDPGPDAVGHGAILYFHGGAFVAGGLNSHRRLAARIARASGVALLNVDYTQLPKGHLLDSIDDAVAAYEHLLARGFAPQRIVFAGDSAGGGLAFAAALTVRDRGLGTPAAIAAIAPYADFDSATRSAHPNNESDAVLTAHGLSVPPALGFARDGGLDPRWSPVNQDFTGMPPALIQVGNTEVLLADTELLADRHLAANVPLTVQIWDNAIHVFQAGADLLPEARTAIAEIGAFVRRTLDGDSQNPDIYPTVLEHVHS
ncbi:alpha/beta hydrolase [Nocardia jejuensis]|uniref:alpha/beta hydrolase n=1 Tax=Nocardia jejuensis TaxID=328049 RepID=UPI000832A9AC|nr:alpha/beta hydrolase [Nocardia jejuensis]